MLRFDLKVFVVLVTALFLLATESAFAAPAQGAKVAQKATTAPKVRKKKWKPRKLQIATVQFSETFNPRENGKVIRKYIAEAAAKGADAVHFHEGALSGYGKQIASADYDWKALKEEVELVLAAAKEHKVWVIVGSAHRLTSPNKPHNSLYIISSEGKIVGRYDKRYCTNGDLQFYSPGTHFATFEINGVKCSALICFDFRFPELYRELLKQDVRVVFHSFNYAGKKGPAKRPDINHTVLQGHAICNNMWISASNSSTGYMRFPGAFISPDAYVEAKLPMDHDKPNMMINKVNLKKKFRYIWHPSGVQMELDCANGKLNSGTAVEDPRSSDRTSH